MSITYDQVATAAEQIIASGGKVSSRSIRAALPCSPNELGPLLRDWKAGRPTVKTADIVLAPEITETIIRQVQTAVIEARAETEDRLRELEEEIHDTQMVGRTNEQKIIELSEQLHLAQTALNTRDGQISELEKSLTDARETAARESHAKEDALKLLGQAEAQVRTIPNLEKRSADLAAQVETERTTREKAQIDIARLTAERDAAIKESTAEIERIKGLQAHLDKAHADTENMRTYHAEHIKNINIELDKTRDAAHAAQVTNARLEAADASNKQLIETLKQALDAAQKPTPPTKKS